MPEPGRTTLLAPTEHLGPLGYLAVALPPDGGADGFTQLLRLVEEGTVYVLDLEFLARGADGSIAVVDAATIDERLARLDGANTHLLDQTDLSRFAEQVEQGATVAVLVYEDRSLMKVLRAWEDGGAEILTEGRVDVDDLQEALGSDEHTLFAMTTSGARS